MRGPTIPEWRTRSCSCRTVKTKTRMDQASGWQENNLQPFRVPLRVEKQRSRCREPLLDTERLRLQESTGCVLLGIRFFNLLFEMRRPCESHEEPHQKGGGH